MEGKLIQLKDAAEQLGYKPSGLYEIVRRTKAGKSGPQIQFFQIGSGPIKFRQEWLDAFVAEHSTEPGRVQPLRTSNHHNWTPSGTPIQINYEWGQSA